MPVQQPAPEPQIQPDKIETGKFHYKDGSTYEGDWKMLGLPTPPAEPVKKGAKKKDEELPAVPAEPPRRVRHGKGIFKSGAYTYEGEWVEDHMQGHGKFTYASGALYEGQWLQNKYHGQGRYAWADGQVYEGSWMGNKMHGDGTLIDADGHRWTGQFYNGAGPGLTCQL
eukprot:jgi/Chrzof1/4178/Cz14g01260.t1